MDGNFVKGYAKKMTSPDPFDLEVETVEQKAKRLAMFIDSTHPQEMILAKMLTAFGLRCADEALERAAEVSRRPHGLVAKRIEKGILSLKSGAKGENK